MSATEQAKTQLAQLEAKLAAHSVKAAEHEADIAATSLPAQTGDVVARERLDGLVAETPALDAEGRSITYAIKATKERVAAAEAAVVDAGERDKAKQALALFEANRTLIAEIEADFDHAITNIEALKANFDALYRLDYASTTWHAITVFLKLAATTKLQRVKLQQEFLAPRQRRDFSGAISGLDNAERRARARIERGLKKEAA